MIEVTIEEAKKINLKELKYIADFCEKNKIDYILSDGTLLGAVRHKGFIPWDMDIDISMLRKDYDRFIQIWKDTTDYALVCPEKYKKYGLSFAKIVDLHTKCYEFDCASFKGGIWVDIFPLDAIPNNEPDITIHFNKLIELYTRFMDSYLCFHRSNFFTYFPRKIKWALKKKDILLVIQSVKSRYQKLLIESTKYNQSKYSNITNNMIIYRKSEKRKYGFPKEVVTDYLMSAFEDYSFRIPKNYDSLLHSYYGNYMELPPKEQQVDTHSLKIYYMENK